MFEKTRTVDLTAKDISVIASALETQRKILQIQASAGEQPAKHRLNETRRLLAQLETKRSSPRGLSAAMISRLSMMFGTPTTR